jgi:hypothetical protein
MTCGRGMDDSSGAWRISGCGSFEHRAPSGSTHGGRPEEVTGLIQTADGGYALSAFADKNPGVRSRSLTPP